MVKQDIKNKPSNPAQSVEDLMINRLMTAFVAISLIVGAILFFGKMSERTLYFEFLPVFNYILLGCFAASVIYFAVNRIMKIDEFKRVVRSYYLIGVFAVLYSGFTMYRYMKIDRFQLIIIFVAVTVLYFLSTIFIYKSRKNGR